MGKKSEAPTAEIASLPPGGPRLPRRLVTLDVPEYPGFTATFWTNHPHRVTLDRYSGDLERFQAALVTIVVGHNGWCDEDGTPFPPADDATFWDAIPNELAAVLIRLIDEAMAQLPNSLRPTRTR